VITTLLRLALIACAWVVPGARAAAAPLSAPALHWVRAPGCESCVEPHALADRVEGLLGAPLVRAAEAQHSVEGLIERDRRGFRARLRLSGPRGARLGERVLEQQTADCGALTEALAFVIAMMIDPEVAAHGLPAPILALLGEDAPEQQLLAELERAPAQPARAVTPRSEPPPPAPPARAAPAEQALAPLRLQLALAGGAASRTGPEPTLLGRLLFALRVAPWLWLGGSVWVGVPVREQQLEDGRSVRLMLGVLEAFVCAGRATPSRVAWLGCAGPALMLRSARGQGFGENHKTTLASAAAAALVAARVRLGARGWGLTALLGMELDFSRPSLVRERPDGALSPVYRTEVASFSLGVGPSFEY
jgi:hypothetical protein